MGRRKNKGREINGIIVIDKPKGLTSNKVLQNVKNIFFAQKAGHTGSLDPLATGALPICFGEATKFAAYLLNANKTYQFVMQLGVVTDTGDAEGEIIETNEVDVKDKQIQKVVKSFIGDIEQIPPMYSALKVNGETLYKLARKGIEVERKARQITIFDLQVVGRINDEVTLTVACSKGTYVRTLAEDIGKQLGCGASIKELRRTHVEPFDQLEMVSMETLEELHAEKDFVQMNGLLLPIDSMLQNYPAVSLDEDMSYYVNLGQAVQISGAPTEGKVRLYNHNDEFVGMGRVDDDGKICPDRLMKNKD